MASFEVLHPIKTDKKDFCDKMAKKNFNPFRAM